VNIVEKISLIETRNDFAPRNVLTFPDRKERQEFVSTAAESLCVKSLMPKDMKENIVPLLAINLMRLVKILFNGAGAPSHILRHLIENSSA